MNNDPLKEITSKSENKKGFEFIEKPLFNFYLTHTLFHITFIPYKV